METSNDILYPVIFLYDSWLQRVLTVLILMAVIVKSSE